MSDHSQTPEQRLDEERRRASQQLQGAARGTEIEAVSERLQTVIDAAERAADAIRYDAEEQARTHLAEAQAKADRLTAERVGLVARLTDDLIEHAGIVKEHSQRMVGALEEAIATVHDRLESAEDEAATGPQTTLPPPSGSRPAAAVESEPERIVEPLPRSGATVEAEVRRRTEVITEPRERTAPPQPPAGSPPDRAAAEPADAAPSGAEPSRQMLLRATQLAVAGGSRESIAAKLREEFGTDPSAALDRVLPENR